MLSEFTPSDSQLRDWIGWVDILCGHGGESIERYDRWLAQHDAEVARRTLEDAADAFHGTFYNVPKGEVPFTKMSASHPYTGHFLQTHDQQMLMRYLRARAASISTDKAGAGFDAPDCADCGTPKTQENADRKLWELHEWPCPLFYVGHWVDGKPERNCACDNPSTDKKEG